jgi:hypothetical protein
MITNLASVQDMAIICLVMPDHGLDFGLWTCQSQLVINLAHTASEYGLRPQSNELTKGTTELVQHFRF